MGANLLSLLLHASVQVVCRLQLGLHSLTIYPGGKKDKPMNQEGSQEEMSRSPGTRDECLRKLWDLGQQQGSRASSSAFLLTQCSQPQ